MKVIITGATGMVGEGVLHSALNSDAVTAVLSISRKACGVRHAKLTELIHGDFLDLSTVEAQLAGYDAVFFCAGVSSLGKSEVEYTRLTHTMTLHMAQTVLRHNPGMTFCYVSGTGTDSSEKGRQMWARVKGRTENDLLKLGFKSAVMFRPGFIKPMDGMQNTNKLYRYVMPLYPLLRAFFPGAVCTLEDLGKAMLAVTQKAPENPVLDNHAITRTAAGI
jgi:uncharacterized protein YbjT (DUF2867 family)